MHILNTIRKVRDDLVEERDTLHANSPGLRQLAQDKINSLDSMIKLLDLGNVQDQLDAMLDARLQQEEERNERLAAGRESYLDATKGSIKKRPGDMKPWAPVAS